MTDIKAALVTGGNRGIGLALVKSLAGGGYKVYMGARSIEKANEALNEIGNPKNVVPLIMELENEDQIKQAYKTYLSLKEENETLSVLINNAVAALDWVSDVSHIPTLEVEYATLEKMYRVNVLAPLFMLINFLPSMAYGTRVVNMASGSGEFWDSMAFKDYQVGYAQNKAALIMLTKKMAAAVQEKGIIVNSCCPGWCQTKIGNPKAPYTAEQGAQSAISALFLDKDIKDAPTGHHWRYGKRVMLDVYPSYFCEHCSYKLNALKKQNNKIQKNPTFLQQIFSVRNENDHKVWRILGIKFSFRTNKH